MNYNYIAIIGEIKNSKKIENRNEIQIKLENVLKKINSSYSDQIASNFTITLGDEFQGLLSESSNVMYILSEIEKALYPIKFRFGIGIGTITTRINRELAIGADGPAYQRARTAIDKVRRNERKNQTSNEYIRVETSNSGDLRLRELNIILSLTAVISDSWTNRQREVIWTMLFHSKSQSEVAKLLGLSQSSFQKSLSSGNFYSYKIAHEAISSAIEELRVGYI
jgi:hypothetical protein